MNPSVRSKVIAIVVFIILLSGGYWAFRAIGAKKQAQQQAALSKEEIPAVAVIAAKRGDIERTFTFTGTLEAKNKAGVVAKMGGKVSRVHVHEGDFVRSGQLLVELEHGDLLAQREQACAAIQTAEARIKQAQTGEILQSAQTGTGIENAEAAVAAAEAGREQARTNLEMATSQTAVSVEQAQQQLEQARARLQALESGARHQEIEIARQRVEQARANRDTAQANLERARKLLAAGAISQQQFDAAQLQFDTALAQYKTAQQQLNLTEEGPRSEEIQIAQAQVNQAQSAVALAQANRNQVQIREEQLKAAEEAVRQAQANLRLAHASTAQNQISQQETAAARSALKQARANLKYLNTQISYTSVRAPISGYVVQRNVQPGEAAVPGMPLINIVDNRKLHLRSSIGESRINKVSVGQSVTIQVDSLPDAEFTGTIQDIIPAANPQSRTFEVKVEVPNSQGRLMAGTFARATVVIERLTSVVTVPRDTVLEDEEGKYVLTNRARPDSGKCWRPRQSQNNGLTTTYEYSKVFRYPSRYDLDEHIGRISYGLAGPGSTQY